MESLTQIFTIAGVVIGALLTYVLSARSESTRYRRQQSQRWDVRELDAYDEYVRTVVLMARNAGTVVQTLAYGRGTPKVEKVEGLKALDDAEIARTMAFERVVMLGDPKVIQRGHRLNETVWRMEWLAREEVAGSQEQWKTSRDDYVQALDEFHTEARKALVVAGLIGPKREVPSPPGPWADPLAVSHAPKRLPKMPVGRNVT